MKMPPIHQLILLAAVVIPSLSMAADPVPMRPIEASIETQSTNIQMPATLSGAIRIVDCTDCPARPLTLNQSTRLLLGPHQVGITDFTRALRNGTRYDVRVAYGIKDYIVTSISMTAG